MSTSKAPNYLLIWLGVAAFFLIFTLLIFEFSFFQNTIKFSSLLWSSLLLGLLASIGLGYYLFPKKGSLLERVKLYGLLGFIFLVFSPMVASLSNRILSFSSYQPKAFLVVKQDVNYSDRFGIIQGQKALIPNQRILYVLYNGEGEKLSLPNLALLQEIQPGDSISLPVKVGLWGFEVVNPKVDQVENDVN